MSCGEVSLQAMIWGYNRFTGWQCAVLRRKINYADESSWRAQVDDLYPLSCLHKTFKLWTILFKIQNGRNLFRSKQGTCDIRILYSMRFQEDGSPWDEGAPDAGESTRADARREAEGRARRPRKEVSAGYAGEVNEQFFLLQFLIRTSPVKRVSKHLQEWRMKLVNWIGNSQHKRAMRKLKPLSSCA